jgi:hypothetical protein
MASGVPTGRAGTRQRHGLFLLAASALLAVLMGSMGIWLTRPSSALKSANFPGIKAGMTRAQVERLLGGPPGDYGHFADGDMDCGDGSVFQVFAVPSSGTPKPQTWTDDRNQFFIFFDSQGQVVAASKVNRFRRSPKNQWLIKLRDTARFYF